MDQDSVFSLPATSANRSSRHDSRLTTAPPQFDPYLSTQRRNFSPASSGFQPLWDRSSSAPTRYPDLSQQNHHAHARADGHILAREGPLELNVSYERNSSDIHAPNSAARGSNRTSHQPSSPIHNSYSNARSYPNQNIPTTLQHPVVFDTRQRMFYSDEANTEVAPPLSPSAPAYTVRNMYPPDPGDFRPTVPLGSAYHLQAEPAIHDNLTDPRSLYSDWEDYWAYRSSTASENHSFIPLSNKYEQSSLAMGRPFSTIISVFLNHDPQAL